MIKKFFVVALLATSLASCAYLDKRIAEFQSTVHTYAPLVGKNLLRVGDILVTASCSPIVSTVGEQVHNVLHIVAPTSNAADVVQSFFVTNSAVTAQLCPLVTAVRASIGSVPNGTPSQVIPTT
jgi:hypothetical protein